MDELSQIAADAGALRISGVRGALCTIVRASGSVFRTAGARMLVREDGTICGHLSGGCLEADLAEHARKVIAHDASRVVRYGQEDQDVLFGVQSGCRGDVEVLIEPLTPRLHDELQLAVAARAFGPVTATTTFGFNGGSTRFFAEAGDVPEFAHENGSGVERFTESIAPQISLLIFGAGPVALPLAQFAKILGWRVVVADHRAALASKELFPAADEIVIAPPESLAAAVRFGARPVALVMAHQWDFDLTLLRDLLPRDLSYLGLLGARARRDHLLAALTVPAGERLHAPAGLALGGESPSEVALSIISEIQAVLNGQDAVPLRDRPGRIHEGPAKRTAAIVLAAGASTRYGEPKQLAQFEGEPLVRRAVRSALDSGVARVFVVAGAAGAGVRAALAGLEVSIVENAEWASGVASSIRAGVNAAKGFDALLLLLGDQPLVTSGQLKAIVETKRRTGSSIVASRYPEGAGVPAMFDASLAGELLRLEGDQGARELIRSRAGEVVLADSSTADVDCPADLAAIGCSSTEY